MTSHRPYDRAYVNVYAEVVVATWAGLVPALLAEQEERMAGNLTRAGRDVEGLREAGRRRAQERA